MIAVTGVSGAGKSSLAFDTLLAEGRARYVETLSAESRRLLGSFPKPDADRLDGLPPAIGIAAAAEHRRSDRATLGSITEIDAQLSLILARLGVVHCVDCDRVVKPDSLDAAVGRIEALPIGTRYQIAFPIERRADRSWEDECALLRSQGFVRFRIAGEVHGGGEIPPAPTADDPIAVIVDRLVRGAEDPARRLDSIETAFARGAGRCLVITTTQGDDLRFDRSWRCASCGRLATPPEPRLFRPTSPLGACPTCEGTGRQRGNRGTVPCPACRGARLRPEALAVRFGSLNAPEFQALTIDEARRFIAQSSANKTDDDPIARRLLAPLIDRLDALIRIGLDYLTLDRPVRTLSQGEARRARLASCIGPGLIHALYVLDEPAIGLHPHDVENLVAELKRLRDTRNTVVIVEHHIHVIKAVDLMVDLGPGAGASGGTLVHIGPPESARANASSVTGRFLNPIRIHNTDIAPRRPHAQGQIALRGASGRNLKQLDVDFPLGVLCAITGVSGSGKSTLIAETLLPAVRRALGGKNEAPLKHKNVTISGVINDVVWLDPSPLVRGPRSNPATISRAYDPIRHAFAATHDAKLHRFDAGAFSFNVEGGRCSHCKGKGFQRIEMQLLADVMMPCPDCGGTRFRPEVRAATYRGKNIAEVLDLTIREALAFFRHRPRVLARLRPLLDVGLDYLRLGQPTATLSAGESQRLKLAAILGGPAGAIGRTASSTKTLFIMDEPTGGLHPADIARILDVFNRLVDLGNSIIVVTHNLDLMLRTDWIIDLGPGPGPKGGKIVAVGTPETVAAAGTLTGQALAAAPALAIPPRPDPRT